VARGNSHGKKQTRDVFSSFLASDLVFLVMVSFGISLTKSILRHLLPSTTARCGNSAGVNPPSSFFFFYYAAVIRPVLVLDNPTMRTGTVRKLSFDLKMGASSLFREFKKRNGDRDPPKTWATLGYSPGVGLLTCS